MTEKDRYYSVEKNNLQIKITQTRNESCRWFIVNSEFFQFMLDHAHTLSPPQAIPAIPNTLGITFFFFFVLENVYKLSWKIKF